MALHGIDVASYQSGLNIATVKDQIDFVIIKATQDVNYVNPSCDKHFQQAKGAGVLRGFYHFAGKSGAEAEAEYFYKNCKNYFAEAIPVLDWEGDQSVDWVNRFVRRLHELSGKWCWIYANPWRFNQGGVESSCARWVASYPAVSHPSYATAEGWARPAADGNVVAWQFASDGRLNGWNANLDVSLFYGDVSAWNSFVGTASTGPSEGEKPAEDKTDGKKTYKVTGTFEVTES